MTTLITATQAVELMQEFGTADQPVDLNYLKNSGFEIVSDVGAANTQAIRSVAVPRNEELIAHVEALVAEGRSKTATGKVLKTKGGQPKHILGDKEQLGGWRVMITDHRNK